MFFRKKPSNLQMFFRWKAAKPQNAWLPDRLNEGYGKLKQMAVVKKRQFVFVFSAVWAIFVECDNQVQVSRKQEDDGPMLC